MPNTTFNISDTGLKEYKTNFMEKTNILNDYNEIGNINDHLLATNTTEASRLQTISNQLRSKLMKAKQVYLLTDYSVNEYTMYNNLLILTIFFACIFVMITATVTSRTLVIWISIVLCLVYLIIVMVVLSSNVKRRKYAWNQWYWNSAEKK